MRDASRLEQRRRTGARCTLLALLLGLVLASCTGVSVRRESDETGTFTSTAWAVSILGRDIPRPALVAARANAAKIQRADLRIDRQWVFPDLGWFDWLLDIVGVRYARVSGSWGRPAEDAATGASATR